MKLSSEETTFSSTTTWPSSTITLTSLMTSDSSLSTTSGTTSTTRRPWVIHTTSGNNNAGGDNLTLILCSTLIPTGLIMIAGIALFVYRQKMRPTTQLVSEESDSRHHRKLSVRPVNILNFQKEFIAKTERKEIEEEFQLLYDYSTKLNSSLSRNVGKLAENKSKNRYVDVIPYDSTRVILRKPSGFPETDYINASFVKGVNAYQKFIATQGPMMHTTMDFFNMILEQKALIIVCLTRDSENDKAKCFKYWPELHETLYFDEVVVTTKSEESILAGDITIRVMEIANENDGSFIEVTQYHYEVWPSKEVPESTRTLRELCSLLRKTLPTDRPSCTVVQSSAGAGRVGVFLTTLFVMQKVIERNVKEIDLHLEVKELRRQRPKFVKTLEEYIFLYKCVNDFLSEATLKVKKPIDLEAAKLSVKNLRVTQKLTKAFTRST